MKIFFLTLALVGVMAAAYSYMAHDYLWVVVDAGAAFVLTTFAAMEHDVSHEW